MIQAGYREARQKLKVFLHRVAEGTFEEKVLLLRSLTREGLEAILS